MPTPRSGWRSDRLSDLAARGWYSADLHVHMNYGGAYRNTPRRLAFQARAEDLDLVENLIVNKEGRDPGHRVPPSGRDPASTARTLIVHDQEYHTSVWGHVGLLGLRDHVLLPGYAGYAATAAASLWPTNADVADLARAQGGLVGYVHPFDSDPDPADTTRALDGRVPGGRRARQGGLLRGARLRGRPDGDGARLVPRCSTAASGCPPAPGTDAMANFASLRGPVGMNRVYVRTGGALDQRRLLDSLKAGRSFATNGPLLEFTLGGRGLGDELRLPVGSHELVARVSLRSNVPVDHLEIVGNGEVVREIPLAGDRTRADVEVRLPVRASGWFLLRARSDRAIYPVLDLYPYATTSPIYVTVGAEPVRSRDDAEYFLRWIARLDTAAGASRDWNTDAEREEALTLIGRARSEFERRRGATN